MTLSIKKFRDGENIIIRRPLGGLDAPVLKENCRGYIETFVDNLNLYRVILNGEVYLFSEEYLWSVDNPEIVEKNEETEKAQHLTWNIEPEFDPLAD